MIIIYVWNVINFIRIIDACYTKLTYQNMSHLHIFTSSIWCVDLVTLESLWCHKGIAMHTSQNAKISTMHQTPDKNGAIAFNNSAAQTKVQKTKIFIDTLLALPVTYIYCFASCVYHQCINLSILPKQIKNRMFKFTSDVIIWLRHWQYRRWLLGTTQCTHWWRHHCLTWYA